MLNLQDNTVAENSFFLWLQFLILILSAIPLVSTIVAILSCKPEWTVPKIYELKIYAVAMLFGMILPAIGKYAPQLLQKKHTRYRLYLLLFYPLAVMFYSCPLHEFYKYLIVFMLALSGIGVLCVDIYGTAKAESLFLSRNYNELLVFSIALSVFVVAFNSEGNTFTPYTITALFSFVIFLSSLLSSKFPTALLTLLLSIFMLVKLNIMHEVSFLHYLYMIGPVIEVLFGHSHPFLVNAQYGSGLTAFLALYFKWAGVVSAEGLELLLKVLTVIQFVLIFYIATSLYQSRKIAFLALVSVIFFNFFSQSAYFAFPSIGFLRFGFIYLILSCYLLEGKIFSDKLTLFLVSILGSIAILWSFESAVYTFPALLFAEFVNKSIHKFIPIFFGVFCVTIFAYFFVFFMQGVWPPLGRYFEYALIYANGFFQLPLNRLTSFWWLFPLLYGFMLIKIATGQIQNKLVAALTIYGIALFTYFGGRSHPNNLFHVSIPFILLGIYTIVNLKSISFFAKQTLLALALMTLFSACEIETKNEIVVRIWNSDIPKMKSYLSLLMFADKSANYSHGQYETDCSRYEPVKKYIENNSIPIIIENEDIPLYQVYTCSKAHNAFGINPLGMVLINENAIKRVSEKATIIPNQYLLIESHFLQPNSKFLEFLQLHPKRIDEIKLGNTSFIVFRRTDRPAPNA